MYTHFDSVLLIMYFIFCVLQYDASTGVTKANVVFWCVKIKSGKIDFLFDKFSDQTKKKEEKKIMGKGKQQHTKKEHFSFTLNKNQASDRRALLF